MSQEENQELENQEQQLQVQQPTPEGETPPEGEKPEEEKKEEIEAEKIPEDSIFAPYQGIRDKMIENGADIKAMDAKVKAGEDLSDEDLQIVVDASGGRYTKEEVAAFMAQGKELAEHRKEMAKRQEDAKTAYVAELQEIAGGSIDELKQFIAANAPQEQINIWNAALEAETQEVQRAVLSQMQAFRQGLKPNAEPKKPSDLGLLTQAANTKPGQQVQADANKNPLESNPLAYLAGTPSGVGTLCAIKLDAKHPQREAAIEVLKVIRPDLV